MNKKEIIKLLEQHFGVKAKYMGTPSFAYQIQAGEEIYAITRNGKIEDENGSQIELDSIMGNTNQTSEEVISADTEEDFDGGEIILPLTGHTGLSLKNLVNMIYSKQTLIQKALSTEEKLVGEGLVRMLYDKRPESLVEFQTLMEDAGNEEYPGMNIDFEEGMITFKFDRLSIEQIKACSEMFALINKSAKTLKHVSSKQSETDNEKYAFRTWLLRLGMIGNEYKAARKILLANLDGNGAFRKPREETEIL